MFLLNMKSIVVLTVASVVACRVHGFQISYRAQQWSTLLSPRRQTSTSGIRQVGEASLRKHQLGMSPGKGRSSELSIPGAAGIEAPKQLRVMWAGYRDALATRPLATKALSSGLISVAGFVLSQVAGNVPLSAINMKQLVVYALVGTLYIPVVLHFWFKFLESVVKSKAVSRRLEGNRWGSALLQLGIDQTVGAALINSGFFAMHTILSVVLGERPTSLPYVLRAVKSKVTREFWIMMRLNWRIWPLANFFNFAFVPVELRVLLTNMVAIVWNVYMARLCGRG